MEQKQNPKYEYYEETINQSAQAYRFLIFFPLFFTLNANTVIDLISEILLPRRCYTSLFFA